MNRSSKILTAALMTAPALPWIGTPAAATPLSQSMGLQNAAVPSVETVYYHRGWYGRGFRPYGYYRYGRGYGYGRYSYEYRPGHPFEFDRQLCCRD